jgi:hypothetical protein
MPLKSTSYGPGGPTAIFLGRSGTRGQQLRGDKAEVAPVAMYAFRNQQVAARAPTAACRSR